MFSKATEYALRATIFIAQKCEDDRKLSLDEIATAIDSPRPFTAKIMQLLTKDGMLVSSTQMCIRDRNCPLVQGFPECTYS